MDPAQELRTKDMLPAPPVPRAVTGGVTEGATSPTVCLDAGSGDDKPQKTASGRRSGARPVLPILTGLPMGLSGEGDRGRSSGGVSRSSGSGTDMAVIASMVSADGQGSDAIHKAATLLLADSMSGESGDAGSKHS
jgi:hypothetical protein